VVQTQSKGGQVVFRLPISRSMEMLRLRADVTEPLPANFFNGTNSFSAPSDSTAGNGVVTLTPGDGGASTPGGSEVRAVKESDIWQIRGSNLYFFNQYRGLQVIDISNPDRASLCGTVELPAAGDQAAWPADLTVAVGRALVGPYAVPLELLGVLLVIALLGALYFARSES